MKRLQSKKLAGSVALMLWACGGGQQPEKIQTHVADQGNVPLAPRRFPPTVGAGVDLDPGIEREALRLGIVLHDELLSGKATSFADYHDFDAFGARMLAAAELPQATAEQIRNDAKAALRPVASVAHLAGMGSHFLGLRMIEGELSLLFRFVGLRSGAFRYLSFVIEEQQGQIRIVDNFDWSTGAFGSRLAALGNLRSLSQAEDSDETPSNDALLGKMVVSALTDPLKALELYAAASAELKKDQLALSLRPAWLQRSKARDIAAIDLATKELIEAAPNSLPAALYGIDFYTRAGDSAGYFSAVDRIDAIAEDPFLDLQRFNAALVQDNKQLAIDYAEKRFAEIDDSFLKYLVGSTSAYLKKDWPLLKERLTVFVRDFNDNYPLDRIAEGKEFPSFAATPEGQAFLQELGYVPQKPEQAEPEQAEPEPAKPVQTSAFQPESRESKTADVSRPR